MQTLTQLSCFLKHVQKHLGVSNATAFEDELQLQDIGMSTGDIIRLKRGSATWWNGPDAKWKHSGTIFDSNPNKPVTKKIAYKTHNVVLGYCRIRPAEVDKNPYQTGQLIFGRPMDCSHRVRMGRGVRKSCMIWVG
ncbi:hypothetical protein PAXRUDRAFT_171852 [Paxillus rubicundulus Ve08.2h10]|uniref:Uncharacterized protein n=1 Tax=Paxillus rubicundulus Ve08.2h10 TaxID=930991 RepID=A0A0D0DE53_9AGAM|nr:hypothetical protein PAXRUDRAFT_171852 [Paxillus rubicundulus Ve08.2h10]